MRTIEEQMSIIGRRADAVRARRKIRNKIIAEAAGIAACAALILLTVYLLPLTRRAGTPKAGLIDYGGLLLITPFMGYVLIGVLSFALGICIALLCIHLKELKKKRNNHG